MPLLREALRQHAASLEAQHPDRITTQPASPPPEEASDEELVGVVSLPGTPNHSRPATRPGSPTRGAAGRRAPGPLLLVKSPSSDPLKAFPTDLGQRIFGMLPLMDLAQCALVSKKWNRSQTLNYVWFQYYRKDNFHDESLPPGKWTRRESRQNWRTTVLQNLRKARVVNGHSRSGYATPSDSMSGYQTPREIREERWKAETLVARPGKLEMREMYKELGGRKARSKNVTTGPRDLGGWDGGDDGW